MYLGGFSTPTKHIRGAWGGGSRLASNSFQFAVAVDDDSVSTVKANVFLTEHGRNQTGKSLNSITNT